MGRQINFFLHQRDQADFDSFLKSFGDIVLIPFFHYNNQVSTVTDTVIRDAAQEGDRIYIIRKKDFNNIPLKPVKEGYWLVDDTELPVIHFDRCVIKPDRIEQGRIYFQTSYYDKCLMIMVRKPDDFIQWGEKIIAGVRRKLKKYKHTPWSRVYTEYLGEHALRWMEFNSAEVKEGTIKSTVVN